MSFRLGATRFWFDDYYKRQITLRSARRTDDTQPLEAWLSLAFRFLPDFYVYEASDYSSREIRLSFRWLWFGLNMQLAMIAARPDSHRCDNRDRNWGWYFMSGGLLVLGLGGKLPHIDLPFLSWQCDGRQVLSLDRQRVVYDDRLARKQPGNVFDRMKVENEAAEANSFVQGYTYTLKSGETQFVGARVHVTRHLRRRTWLPFVWKDDTISVEFTEEVGEGTGSWKGGVVGCGYTLKRGESPQDCLRRMEIERRFDR